MVVSLFTAVIYFFRSFFSSRLSMLGKSTPSKSREDISLKTPSNTELKKASFVEVWAQINCHNSLLSIVYIVDHY